jgi:hypothetical protein
MFSSSNGTFSVRQDSPIPKPKRRELHGAVFSQSLRLDAAGGGLAAPDFTALIAASVPSVHAIEWARMQHTSSVAYDMKKYYASALGAK